MAGLEKSKIVTAPLITLKRPYYEKISRCFALKRSTWQQDLFNLKEGYLEKKLSVKYVVIKIK